MATFKGTNKNETITPTFMSPSVVASGGDFPGSGSDTIRAGGGNDTVAGSQQTVMAQPIICFNSCSNLQEGIKSAAAINFRMGPGGRLTSTSLPRAYVAALLTLNSDR